MPELRGTIGQDIWQGDSVSSNNPGATGRGSTGRASEVMVDVHIVDVPRPSSARYAIGIDVGGTKIAGAIVDVDSGAIVAHAKIVTGARRGGEAVLADAVAVSRRLEAFAAAKSISMDGVGVGVPELVNLDGSIMSSQCFDWRPLDVSNAFSDSVPVLVQSDVIAAALAESLFGAGKDCASFLYVSVGTGISSSFVIEGRPWQGARGNAIILASGSISTLCQTCGTASTLIPEDVASGRGLVRQYHSRGGRADVTSATTVVAVAESGDELARRVVADGGHMLGAVVGFAFNLLDPHRVVVGGGLGLSGGIYWDSFLASVRDHVWGEAATELEVVQAGIGSRAGVVGVAVAVGRAKR